ncbi:dihydroxy-acid dehydratase [Vineibacter terrae]|uniref:Dihydroxy-acid dehydratase n=1 Tax=Vineibacter terrae TaxID=2586908 RepID=A0A5C8PUV6_9HYPH|nr:L-arabinonate dehydratase [Vineibacter terrae]TXL81851.1 dihydroxy-acid dehydratase [Vineibacter terrae]
MTMRRKTAETLRSYRWYGVQDLRAFGHRSRTKQMGFARQDWAGKPVIGVINTWSEANPCHVHLRQRAEEVKRGIWQAGGFPLEMPAMSLGEPMMKPTTMMYRNLLAMETEELLRANPIDGAVLLGGCDKNIPGLLMGAISMNLPAIVVPAGPMLRGNWRGKTLGSGSDVWKYWAEMKAGGISEADWDEMEDGIARSFGTCMVMGTAATMMSVTEALGFTLPGASSIPAADSGHARMATESGRRIVDMVWEDLKPSDILSPAAFDNAIRALMGLGGSTNGIVHLLAWAGRAGVPLDLERFDRLARDTPLIANIRPAGQHLMEDFFYAGGMRAFLAKLAPLLTLSAPTVSGKTLGDDIAGAETFLPEIILDADKALKADGSLAVLKGNLAPDGAVIKPAAADPRLHRHVGPALVFDDYNDMAARIDDPALDVTADTVLVLKQAGPLGGPGMPEWGMLPIPQKLLKQGVRDMVRISDGRMSGTSYGACVLHVTPESHVGGPLALVRTGDLIALDVEKRSLDMQVSDAELARRRAAWKARPVIYERGYGWLFARHVQQADKGCDFDFLRRDAGAPVPEPEIH